MVNHRYRFYKKRSFSLKSQQGAIYVWMLLSLIFLSLGVGQWAVNYATLQQREKEQELLRVGLVYRKAIYQYYQDSPGGIKTYPEKLEDLLKDPRYLEVKRHLRKLDKDPMTSTDFILIKNSDGQIIGVHSRSQKVPIKKTGFLPSIQKFENAINYEDWVFSM